jgi:RimJ/RimL family protein N-acetyltransferase
MGLFDFFKKKKATNTSVVSDNRVKAEAKTETPRSVNTFKEEIPNSVSGIKQEPIRQSYYRLEDIKSMRMGESLMIVPYDAGWLLQTPDYKILPLFANSEKIRRFLPGLGFETEESCRKKLEAICVKTEAGLGFTYFIREQGVPIGMITVDSPLYNAKAMNLRIWSVDFFIIEHCEHQGYMFNALARVLNQLKGMGIQRVHALVDVQNTSCIRLLKGLFQQEIDNTHFASRNPGDAKPRVFVIDLSTINFQRR